jgi:hypothetical protein
MKKTSFIATALFIAAFAMFNPSTAHAQKAKGQVVATGGVGFSLVGLIMNVVQDGINTTDQIRSTKTPVIFGSGDFGITDRFSVGACYTYQGLSMKYSSYTTTDTSGNSVTVIGDFTDRLTRQSIGIRPLFHFGDSEDLDLYVGARFSYVFWNYNSSRNNFDGADILKGFGSPVKPQFILGMRYFFIPTVGFNAEFAIGPTYFMAFGVCARFGGM